MDTKIDLKNLNKYNLIIPFGSFGRIKLLIKWNNYGKVWVMGAETIDGSALFYGQPLIQKTDLFRNWRNKGVPRGILVMLDSVVDRGLLVEPNLENITDFSLYYIEG